MRRPPFDSWCTGAIVALGSMLFIPFPLHAQSTVAPSAAYHPAVAIEVPAYYGIQPRLRLVYDSGVGDGVVGVGWRLSGPSEVQRVSLGRGAPRFDATDVYLLDGQEIVSCEPGMTSPSCAHPTSAPGFIAYAFRTDTFQRVAFQVGRTGGRWHVWDKNGTRYIYAPHTYALPLGRLFSPRVTEWRLASVEDTSGHVVNYNYVTLDGSGGFAGEGYLNEVTYNNTIVRCYYEVRPDIRTYAGNGAQRLQRQRLRTIDVTVRGSRARAYTLEYDPTMSVLAGQRSRLLAVKQYGTDAAVDPDGAVTGSSLPVVRMTYTPAAQRAWASSPPAPAGSQPPVGSPPPPAYPDTPVANVRVGGAAGGLPYGPIVSGDFNGDGRTDWLIVGLTGPFSQRSVTVRAVLTGAPAPTVTSTSQAFVYDNAWVTWDRISLYAWSLDLNGDGRSDLMIGAGYQPSADPVDEQVALMPVLSRGDGTFAFGTAVRTNIIHHNYDPAPPACRPGDFDGNGLMDLACYYVPRDNPQVGATENALSLVISQRDGTLAISDTMLAFHVSGSVRPFAVGDVDRDGRSDLLFLDPRGSDLDLVAAGNTTSPIRYDLVTGLSRGATASSFSYRRQQSEFAYVRGSRGYAVLAAADLNGDGRSDFLVLPYGASGEYPLSIQTAIAQPDGTLTLNDQAVPTALSTTESIITVGDADGDGRDDLLVASKRAMGSGTECSNIATYDDVVLNRVRSNGDGTFALPAAWNDCSIARQVNVEWNPRLRPFSLHSMDTNGDGLSDFLIAGNAQYDDTTAILHDDVSVNTGLDTFRWIPVELNGDGRSDFVFIQPQGNQTRVYTLIAQTGGGFTQRSQGLAPDLFGLGRQALRGWKALDVDGDGRTDLVYIHSAGMSAAGTAIVEVEVLFADGNGTWNQAFPQRFTWPGGQADATLIPGDVDGDGKTDLLAVMNGLSTGTPGSGVRVQILNATGNAASPTTSGYVNAFTMGSQSPPFAGTGEDSGLWRTADVDGDGRMDLLHLSSNGSELTIRTLLARPNGQWTLATAPPIPQGAADDWTDVSPVDTVQWHEAEVNGDGMTDLVHVAVTATGLRFHTLLSNGNGASWLQRSQDLPVAADDLALLTSRAGWTPADLDGDGRMDLVHVEWTSGGVRVDAVRSTGDGKFTALPDTVPDPSTNGNRASPTWQVADLDGDGKGDLVRIDLTAPSPSATSQLEVSNLTSSRPSELLTSITNSLGGTTTVTYAPLALYGPIQPSYGCSVPAGTTLQVVSSVAVGAGRGTTETTRFVYACPRWSTHQRAFLGWTDVNASVAATANRPAVSLMQRYAHTDACQTQILDRGFVDAAGAYVGSREMTGYAPPPPSPPYRCVMEYRNRIEYGMSASTLNAYTSFVFDEVGNTRSIVDYGAVAAGGDEVTTTITYKYAWEPWIVALPWQQITSDPARPGSVLRSTFYCYDGNNGTASSNCPGDPTKGLLTGVQCLDDLGLYVTNTFQYDAFGNIAAQQDPLRFGKAAFFDSTFRQFPESVVKDRKSVV